MAYTQSPPLTPEEIDDLLTGAKVARFCSYNREGTIHAVPVWYTYENERSSSLPPRQAGKPRMLLGMKMSQS